MKLIFIIGCLQGGGAEHVFASLCNALSQRGHEIIAIYNYNNKDYELSEEVRQIDFNSIEYNTNEGNIISRYYKKTANRIRDFLFFKRIVKRERPQAVVSFMRNRAEILWLACMGDVPLVFSEHSSMLRKPTTLLARFVRYVVMPQASAITVLTESDKQYVQKELPRTVVMPNALSFSPITEAEYIDSFARRKHLFACGRLTPMKGFDNLIEAFSRIADKFPSWNLDIAGKDIVGGNHSKELKKMVEAKGLIGRVNFIGYHTDVKSLMKAYSIYCLSSRSEGFSLTLTEAMASGMATVSYDLSGPHEITRNNEDGLLVEDQNIDALAEGMQKLMIDEKLRYNLGLKAINNVKRFDSNIITDRWETFLSTLK